MGAPPKQPDPPFETLPDIGLFASPDCMTSCWQGLRPLVTTEDEIRQFFAENGFEDVHSLSLSPSPTTYLSTRDRTSYNIGAIISENRVYSFAIYHTPFLRLTIQQVILALGEPPYIFPHFQSGGDTINIYPWVILYYPEQGFTFRLQESDGLTAERKPQNKIEICISEKALIHYVEISPVDSIETRLTDPNSLTIITNMGLEDLEEWGGFGCMLKDAW
jgi:hypothetical protein